jgi:pimeloyl-ACP methyl ester carboxylesterase
VGERSPGAREPVVVLGGFLSTPGLYTPLARALEREGGAQVHVVPVGRASWMGAVSARGWSAILRTLHRSVDAAAASSPTGRVVLVGHSAGGVMGRLYLSPDPFRGESFGGLERVSRLVTLGSPHHGHAFSAMRRHVDGRYPGAYFAPHVSYVTVAGSVVRGRPGGSVAERFAARAYARLDSPGDAWGDGLVPVDCALLEGAVHVVLEGVGHAPPWWRPWYGTPAIVSGWWPRCSSARVPALDARLDPRPREE